MNADISVHPFYTLSQNTGRDVYLLDGHLIS
jgi:hypothetical protein